MGTHPALLFGTIALQSGRLTQDALNAALQEQQAAPAPVGEICRRKGLLSSNQVRRILEAQRNGALAEAETRLGLLAVQNGFVPEEVLGAALEEQKAAAKKLGEILLDRGALSSQSLQALLAAQTRLRGGAAADEEDLDTREVPVVAAPDAAPPDPRAWMIHESTEGRSDIFAVGRTATLGRMPNHEVPVPDMGSSRHHARLEFSVETRRHVLTDLDSRNGTYVNGERLTSARPLSPGDHVRIGETVFRYAVGPGIGLGEQPAGPMPAPAPTVSARVAAWADAARRAVARIAPGIHPQRQFFVVASWVGMLATFFVWTHRTDGTSALGTRGLGLVTFALFAAILGISLVGDRSRRVAGRFLAAVLAASTLAALVGMIRLVVLALDPAISGGIGLHLATLASVLILLTLWIGRRPDDATPLPDPRRLWGSVKGAAALAGGTTVRLIKGMAGRKAHEKAIAFRRRDDLLRVIGESARRKNVPCVETDLVVRAEHELGESKKRADTLDGNTPPKDAIIVRHELKNAELRLERSLQKLGRSVIDRGVPIDDERTRIAEVMLLDQRVRELG